jgi:hypothetical protein
MILLACTTHALAIENDDGENIALRCATYQAGSADDGHTAHFITDGSRETYWENQPEPNCWLDVDFGEWVLSVFYSDNYFSLLPGEG